MSNSIRLGAIPNPPDKLFVFPHLEMGDALVCNGLCRTLAASGRQIVWLARATYVFAVRRMFADLPNVQVLAALDYEEVKQRWLPVCPGALKLGYFSPPFNDKVWDQEFYRQAGVPFENRWTHVKFPPDLFPAGPRTHQEFVLVHHDPSRNMRIDESRLPAGLPYRFITLRPSFWDWMPEVLSARELHVIDSSFLNLAESLWTLGCLSGTRLVWHKYSKKYPLYGGRWPQLRGPWEVLE